MKRKIVISIAIMVFSVGIMRSQNIEQEVDLMKSILKSEMKVFIAQNIKLKTAEADEFWAIYDTFENELKPIVNERWSLMKKIIKNDGQFSEAEIDKMIKAAIKLQQKRIALRAKYYNHYKKKMGIGIASQFYQLDQYIHTLTSASLNEGIPFVIPQ